MWCLVRGNREGERCLPGACGAILSKALIGFQHYNEPLWVSDKRRDMFQNTSEEGTPKKLVKGTAQGKQCVANRSGTRWTCFWRGRACNGLGND